MAYTELIKNFERVRDYIREFYVYGFRTRGQYDKKSARSYDNERRRLESWLGDYVSSHRTREGKNVFLSIDSRAAGNNPLYRALKSKSFTDGDITLHFLLFDILHDSETALPLSEITEKIDGRLSRFDAPMSFEQSNIRKKLSEYIELGLIRSEKQGRQTLYRRADEISLEKWRDALEFFSEAGVCGAFGSFLLDKMGGGSEVFAFKRHYITHVLESEVLCALFEAIGERRCVKFSYYTRNNSEWNEHACVPLKIYVSVQTGRRWLVGYDSEIGAVLTFRLDYLRDVSAGEICPQFSALREMLDGLGKHIWNMSLRQGKAPERVSFVINPAAGEEYMITKLEREKRCGTVERLDGGGARFTAYVYDSRELVPWIRSFIGCIESLEFENKEIAREFRSDLEKMYGMYGV